METLLRYAIGKKLSGEIAKNINYAVEMLSENEKIEPSHSSSFWFQRLDSKIIVKEALYIRGH